MESTNEPRGSRLSTNTAAKIVLIGVPVLLFVVFAIQNAASITVEFLAWEFQMRRIILMALSALMGVTVWELAGLARRRRKERQPSQGG